MSLWSFIRSKSVSTLVESAVIAGVLGYVIFRLGAASASRRQHKDAIETIQNWEGEGGNVVAPQPGDDNIAPPPTAVSERTT